MAYKVLGFVVWQGAKWYVKRRLPDPRLVAVGAVVAGVAVAAVAGRRHLA